MTPYELVKEVYSKNLALINMLIEQSRFPHAFKVLLHFYHKIEDLRRGLEIIEKAKAFYSSQALSNVLNEHFLVAFYLFTKTRLEKHDDCASDYLEYYPLWEMIQRDNGNARLNKTYDPRKTPLANFFREAPDYRGTIEESDIEDLHKRASQFNIERILAYIQDNISKDDTYPSLAQVVFNSCKKYNETAAYVHGGRLAELQALENSPPTDKGKVMSSNTMLGSVYAQHTLSFVMLLLMMEYEEFAEIYQSVIDFMESKLKSTT